MQRVKNYKYFSYSDYYPFGMQMPDRNGNSEEYRYSFNGMEKDDEARGKGNQYQFGDYSYDPRLARRFSIDPMAQKYPWQSPYAVFNNNPIYYKDPNGLEGESYIGKKPTNISQGKADRRMAKFERKAERVANQLGLDMQNLSQQDFNQIKSNMDSRYGTKNWYYIVNQSTVTTKRDGVKSNTGHQGLTNVMILSDY
jgi:RHS repeat-associated protein